jgi:hypothetical protein
MIVRMGSVELGMSRVRDRDLKEMTEMMMVKDARDRKRKEKVEMKMVNNARGRIGKAEMKITGIIGMKIIGMLRIGMIGVMRIGAPFCTQSAPLFNSSRVKVDKKKSRFDLT